VILAALLRFMQVGEIRYGYDHSYPAFQILGLLDGGQWPIVGQPSSVFLDNPVLMAYIQAVPLLLWRSPLAVQLFVLVFNSIAVWFVYKVTVEMLDRNAGLAAAFLFAINPWIVYFSRTTWVQSLVPFLMVVIAWGLWPSWVRDRPASRRFLAGGVAVTLLTQTYIAAWGVLPQIGLLLVIFRRKNPRRELLAGLAIFFAAVSFFVFGLMNRSEVNSLKAGAFFSESGLRFSLVGFDHALRFVTGRDFRATHAAGNPSGTPWEWVSLTATIILTILFALGLIKVVQSLRRYDKHRPVAIVLLMWFFIPVLLTLPFGAFDLHPHYLLLTLPAGQIIAAWGAMFLLKRPLAPILLALFLGVGFIQAHDLFRANQLVAAEPIWPNFDGWSLRYATDLGREVRQWQQSTAGDFPRVVIADGHDSLISGMSATYSRTIGNVNYPEFVLLSDSKPLLYIIDGNEPIAAWLTPWFEPLTPVFDSSPDSIPYTLAQSRLVDDSNLAQYSTVEANWPSEAGLTLFGYTLNGELAPGQTIDLLMTWRVQDLHPDRGDWFVSANVHLVDSTGQILANIGDQGQWAYRWDRGDVYIQRLRIPVPETIAAGPYHLSLGLFDSIRQTTYQFILPEGQMERYDIPILIRSN
jgi:uncharacterized membrane protein